MPPLLSDLTNRLASISETPALDASVLIAQIVRKPRTWVMAHPELTLTAEQQEQLGDALTQLAGLSSQCGPILVNASAAA